MKHWKTAMIIIASLVLTMFLGLAGCDDNHRGRRHIRGDRDHPPRHYDRDDPPRHHDRDDDDRDRH